MTPKQKRIIAALALANGFIILALVVLITPPFSTRHHPFGGVYPERSRRAQGRPLPTSAPGVLPQGTCQTPPSLGSGEAWDATQLLAQAGLGGTATLNRDGVLRFEIACPCAPGQTADEVAQLAWVAFDVALALSEDDECSSFNQVAVSITSQTDHGACPYYWQVSASVSMADLVAFSAGELSEDEFVERVTYMVDIQ